MPSILDGLGPKKAPSIFDGINAEPEGSSMLRRLVADPAITAAKGIIGVPEAAVGIADLVSGGRAGQAVEGAGVRFKEAKSILDDYYTPEQKAANKAVQQADGFFPTLAAAAQNPSTIPHAIVESLPAMLGGGAIAGALRKGLGMVAGAGEGLVSEGAARLASRGGAIGRAAIGEGAVSGGQNAEQVRQEDPNGTLTPGQSAILAASGALTGGITLGAGRVARKLGITDIDTALAGGGTGAATAGGTKKGVLRRGAEGFFTEGVLEELPQSAQEQMAQNLAQGKPLNEGVGNAAAMGLLTGGAQGGLTAAAFPGRQRPAPAPAVAPPIVEPESAAAAFQRAYGVDPGGLTDEQVSAIEQKHAEDALTPPAAKPFDPATYYDGFAGDDPTPPAAPAPPADPLHRPDAGALTRAAATAVDTGIAANPFMPTTTAAFTPRAEVTLPPDLQMQNRDRSRPGSIQQMNAIANNPDYDRLGVGRSPNEAAPMVSVGANAATIPEADFGTTSRVVMGDGSKIPIRYAVVEAPAVLASHNVDGSVNGDYFAQVPPGTIRALNNGRTAALQAAYQRGTTEGYIKSMVADAAAHGVSPEAIMAKKNPMLVRVYDDAENARPNMGAISNPQVSLKASAPEQAQNDARLLDVSSLKTDDTGGLMNPNNETTLKQFLAAIPQSEQNELVTKDGYTKQFADRVKAAVFAKAYGNADIVSQAVEDRDPETKNVLHALTMAAPEFAKVDHGARLDVRPAIIEAIGILRVARARGMKASEMAAHPDLLGRDPMTQAMADFMVQNSRSPKRMAAAFAEAARFLQAEQAAASTSDMFGRPPATVADLAARVNNHLEKTFGPETTLIAAEKAAPVVSGKESATPTGERANAAPDGNGGQSSGRDGAGAAPGPAREQHDVSVIAPEVNIVPAQPPETVAIARADARVARLPAELQLTIDTVQASADIKKLAPAEQVKLMAHYRAAAQAKAGFDALLSKIAKEVNGKPLLPGLKGIVRAVAKIEADYTGDAGRIKDVLRGTVAVDTVEDARAAVAAIRKAFDVQEQGQRDQFVEEAIAPIDGYRDAKFNVTINGITAEVQVGIAEMLEAKENGPGHALYNARQDIERRALKEKRDFTAAEWAEIDRLNEQMRALYGAAWAAATSARNDDSETGAPLRRIEPGSNSRGGETSKQAQTGTPPQANATGIPSTSKNSTRGGNEEGSEGFIDSPIVEESGENSKLSYLATDTFFLSESKRRAAINPAQMSLFDDAAKFILKSVEKLVDPKLDTPKGRTARESALRELTQAGRINVLAASINVDMITDGSANILGQRVTSLADLAAAAQVYRDPRFETLHYVLTKGDVVVYETAVSSRLPAATASFSGDYPKFMTALRAAINTTKADGVYMIHNHPSGNATASEADLRMTEHFARLMPSFKGHVVIDTNEYSTISMAKRPGDIGVATATKIKADFGGQAPQRKDAPAIGAGNDAALLGMRVRSAFDMARFAQQLQRANRITLVGLGNEGTIAFAGAIDRGHLFDRGLRTSAMIGRAARASGSGGGMFITGLDPDAYRAAKLLVWKGILRDAIDENGNSALSDLTDEGATIHPFNTLGHKDINGRTTQRVGANEPLAPYDQDDLFGDAHEINAKAKAAVKRKAPAIAALPSSQFDLFGNAVDTDTKGGRNGQSGKDGATSVGGSKPRPVPATNSGGNPDDLLSGAGAGNTGSGVGNDGRRPGGTQGVQPEKHPVANPEGGDSQRPATGGAGNRPGYLPAIPAGRDIPAKTGRNFTFTDAELSYEGGWLAKARQNMAALHLLRDLQKDGRQATRDEQAVLAKYIGWGAGELANKLFGKTLDKEAAGLDAYAVALAAFDASGAKVSTPSSNPGGHWKAHSFLVDQGKTRGYTDPITRAEFTAVKPDKEAGSWLTLRNELRDMLTDEEWTQASKSTQYAHYTAKEIVRGMWSAMKRMGFRGGALLEPGSGIGVFPGLMDAELANNTSYTGIEFEPIAGAILKQLFPDERVLIDDFTKTPLPKDFYDAAIGNPPFASFAVLADTEYKKHGFLLHDYFFAKTIDRVKPGGLLTFVSSHGTMDKRGDKARQYLAERADLVGAIRLPQTAFKKNAGTEVVTDVLFLRKKVPGETFEQGHAWLNVKPITGEDGKPLLQSGVKGLEPIFVNEYFHAHPEMVLGAHSTIGKMRKEREYTVLPRPGDITQHFIEATKNLPENVHVAGTSATASQVQSLDFDPKAKKEGGFYLSPTGTLMRMEGGVGRPAMKDSPVLKAYVPLRDALKQAQFDQLNNGPWEASLKQLQKAYAKFKKDHGFVLQNKPYERTSTKTDEVTGEEFETVNKYRRWKYRTELSQDPDYWLVAALENVDEESDVITQSPMLTERTLQKPGVPEIKTAADAMMVALNDTGKIDIPMIADLAGISQEEAIASLAGSIYRAPSGEWQTADDYLSGDVRNKLTEAMAAAASDKKFESNVEALRAVQPREIKHTDISVRLGMTVIKPEVYKQFAREKLGIRANINYIKATGKWVVEGQRSDPDVAGRMTAAEILDHAMTGAPIRATQQKQPRTNPPTYEMDVAATAAANAYATQMQHDFKQWLWSDDERTTAITADYNNTFNTIVPRQFDGRHLSLPGASKLFNIFDHVKRGAWRIIQTGNTYLAHAVGSGKTFQMIISAMEQKRLGLIKKPMMVVPRHMLAQFAAEWQALYPTARLMVADEKAFHTDNRREFVARAALSDLDGIVMTHSSFKLLDLDGEYKAKLIERELESYRAALMEATGEREPKVNPKTNKVVYSRDPKIKQIEAAIEGMKQKLEAAASSAGKDVKTARFDEMGVDMLYVDEAHEYRRLAYPTQRQMKGIQPGGSDQAFDMWMKTRWLEEKNPGRSLVMASGTPVTNTVAELYNVMRMMAPDELENKGIARFDEWASMFGREATKLEPDAGGEYINVTRFARFANLPELSQIFRKFADVLNATELGKLLGDQRPTVKGGGRKIVVAPMTRDLRGYRETLRDRMRISRDWKPSREEPNNPDPIIAIGMDARLAAIDMRFTDPTLPSDPKSKLNTMIDGIIRVYKESNEPGQEVERGTQIVFSDIGFGEGVIDRRGFNTRLWFQKRLRDAGIPMEEVAFIQDYSTAQKRLTLFRKVNEGKVRVLFGGSRNLGTGTNVQKRLRALHHLDTPWFPAHLEQREGRIIRANNKNKEVEIYGYATKGSYDETMWKLVATKQRFVEQGMSGDPNLREVDDVSEVGDMEMASALLADDERVLELAGLRSEVEQLNRLYSSFEDDKGRAQRELMLAHQQIERIRDRVLPNAEKMAARVQDLAGDKFTAKIGGTEYTKRKEFGEAMNAAAKALATKVHEGAEQIGEISGFPIMFHGRINKSAGKIMGYDVNVYMRVGDQQEILSQSFNDDPLGLAMRFSNTVAQLAKEPARLKENIAAQKSAVHALLPRTQGEFPLLAELTEKANEANALEADIIANPYVDPDDIPAPAPAPETGPEGSQWLSDGGAPLPAESPVRDYGKGAREDRAVADMFAPGIPKTGASVKQTKQTAALFDGAKAEAGDGEFQMHHLFDDPKPGEIVRLADKVKVYNAKHGWMTLDQAKAKIEEWEDNAVQQGKKGLNSDKVVLSLFDLTGVWSRPWEQAGYDVYRFDIQNAVSPEEESWADPESDDYDEHLAKSSDINHFSVEFFSEVFGAFNGKDVYAVLAGVPCTDFASSGARHFAAKDADGRTVESVELVEQTLRTIEFFKPSIWAIENPVGRIEKLAGLPPWRSSFDPNHLGDPYTKKTLLWGRHNADMPIAPVEPTEGSKMHSQYGGKSQATKNARSVTPEGFAYAFFMANNAVDHPEMAIANKYDRLNPKAIKAALDAGLNENQIGELVDDPYYFSLDDEKANKALFAAAKAGKMPPGSAYEAPTAYGAKEQTPLFKHWFGDSKVKDKDGNPLVVYHGTVNDFAAFKRTELGKATSHPTAKAGFVFSTSPATAEKFALNPADYNGENDNDNANIIPAHLSITNPLEIGMKFFHDNYVSGRNNFVRMARDAQAAGRDGIHLIADFGDDWRAIGSEYEHDTWIAFKPSQIKSSAGNNGNFNPKKRSIVEEVAAPYAPTSAFDKWFGDSKVVDAAGEPKKMYHGTRAAPTRFKRINGMAGHFGVIAAANDKVRHDIETQGLPGSPSVLPVYLSIKNPVRMSDVHFDEYGTMAEDLVQRRVLKKAGLPHPWDKRFQVREATALPDLIATLEARGFDGIVYENRIEAPGTDSWIPFHPGQVKSAVGNRGTFDTAKPSIVEAPIFGYNPRGATPEVRAAEERRAAPQPPKDAPDWVKKMPADMQEALRKSGVWVQKKTLKERAAEFMQDAGLKVLQGTIDQFAPVLKRLGDYPYKLLRMASAYDAGLEASLFSGRLRSNSAGALEVIRDTKGVIEILKPLNGEVDRFLSWVAGNRADSLKAEDREHLFGDTDIAQLKSLNRKLHDGDTFPGGEPRAMVYARVLKEYNEFSKSILDIAEKAGIINAEGRQTWERNFYVPFYREQEDATPVGNVSGMVSQYAFKRLKGGSGVLKDLLTNSIQNWSHLLQASLKNNAARVTLERAVELGAAHPVAETQGEAQLAGIPMKGKGAVYVLDNGKKAWYDVDDPLILDAISSLEATPFRGPAMRFFGAFKHALTFGATVSPTFRIRNLLRDTVQSLASGKGSYNPLSVWTTGFKYSSRNNPEYYNLLAGGAFFRMGSHLEGDRAAYIKKMTARGLDTDGLIDSKNKAQAVMAKAWEWYQETGERSESINRATRYKETYALLVAGGMDHDRAHFEAAYAARDLMDFSLHGKWAAIRMLTQMVPFMNARLQGLYKLGRAGAEDPRRFAAVVGGVALASMALALYYAGDKDWEEREEWDKDNNWWFKIGDKAFRIPKPFEVGAMGTIAERALEVALAGFDAASRERFINRLWPLVASQLSMNPIPQAFSPALQLWANKNSFTGRPIESEHDMKLPTSQRIGANTSATAQVLGKAGILSPEQIDFAVSAYFAWVGIHALAVADLAVRPMLGATARPAPRTDNYFIVGDFVKDMPASQSRFVSQFYDHLKKTQEAMGELRNAQQLGQKERVAALAAEGAIDLRLAPAYSHAAAQVSKINAAVRRVQASDISADEKRVQIDRLNDTRNRMATAIEAARAKRQDAP